MLPLLAPMIAQTTRDPAATHTWPACASIGIIIQLAAACLHYHAGGVADDDQRNVGKPFPSSNLACHHNTPRAGLKPKPCKPVKGTCEQGSSGETSLRLTFRRSVSSSTALRCLFVTQAMATCLSLRDEEHESENAGSTVTTVDDDISLAGAGSLQQSSVKASLSPTAIPVFCRTLTMRDSAGQVWPVVYEGIQTCGQHHRRLTHGWREFCRHHQVRHGDAVEFRRCAPGNQDTVTVRVVRRGRMC